MPPKECRCNARPAGGAATARRLPPEAGRAKGPTASWQPETLPTQGWRSASRTARSRRSGPADRSRRFPACSDAAEPADFTRYSPSSTPQLSRRAVPYHVQLSGPRGPGRAPDQQIRWHTRAQASLYQRRRAPFCPSKCPSGPAPTGPRHTGHPQIRRPFEHTCQSIRGSARTQGTSERRAPGGPFTRRPTRTTRPSRYRASRLIRKPTWRTHPSVSACRSLPEQPHDVRICRDERVIGRIVMLLAPRAGVLTTDRARNLPSSVTIIRSPTGSGPRRTSRRKLIVLIIPRQGPAERGDPQLAPDRYSAAPEFTGPCARAAAVPLPAAGSPGHGAAATRGGRSPDRVARPGSVRSPHGL